MAVDLVFHVVQVQVDGSRLRAKNKKYLWRLLNKLNHQRNPAYDHQ